MVTHTTSRQERSDRIVAPIWIVQIHVVLSNPISLCRTAQADLFSRSLSEEICYSHSSKGQGSDSNRQTFGNLQ